VTRSISRADSGSRPRGLRARIAASRGAARSAGRGERRRPGEPHALRRLPELAMAEPAPDWRESSVLRGLKRLRVRF
jgi:hypothetical protein